MRRNWLRFISMVTESMLESQQYHFGWYHNLSGQNSEQWLQVHEAAECTVSVGGDNSISTAVCVPHSFVKCVKVLTKKKSSGPIMTTIELLQHVHNICSSCIVHEQPMNHISQQKMFLNFIRTKFLLLFCYGHKFSSQLGPPSFLFTQVDMVSFPCHTSIVSNQKLNVGRG